MFRGLLGEAAGYQGRWLGVVEDPLGAWLRDQGRCCGHSQTPARPGEHWETLTCLLRLLLGLVLILPGGQNRSSDIKTLPPFSQLKGTGLTWLKQNYVS